MSSSFLRTIGRHKTAVAQAHVYPGQKGEVTINGKAMSAYFPTPQTQDFVLSPFSAVGLESPFSTTIKVTGGGMNGQAHAIRLALARALVKHEETWRTSLKKLGYLMRDPRKKERKKFGKKSARRSPQWAKR